MLVTYLLSLKNVVLHETCTFYCVTAEFSVENCEYWKFIPGWSNFKENTGVSKMGSAFKMTRRREFAYYLRIRGNIIV